MECIVELKHNVNYAKEDGGESNVKEVDALEIS